MKFRRILFWAHLVTGLTVGLVVAFLAITGAVLSFAPQWQSRAERGTRASVSAGRPCVTPSALLRAATAMGAVPTALTLFRDGHQPAEIALGNRGAVLLADGCSGRVLGPGANRLRVFFGDVRDLHHMMSTAGPHHQTLRAVKNAAVLLFTFLILSGLVLWWPRSLSRKHLGAAALVRPGLRGRAREWNLHTVAGFWLALPLLTICLTGLVMAYPWANALLFRAAGETPPIRRPPANTGAGSRDAGKGQGRATRGAHAYVPAPGDRAGNAPAFQDLDAPFAGAWAYAPWAESISLRLPPPASHPETLQFQLAHDRGSSAIRRDQLTVAVPDGRVLRFESPQTASRGRHWRFVVRFLHTGELFGAAGQFVALLSTLAALLLVWTGFSLSLRRGAAWRRRTRRRQSATTSEAMHATGD